MSPWLVLLAILLVACEPRESRPKLDENEQVWRVGVERQLPPVAFVDGRRVRGLAVEMIKAVAEFQGYRVELVPGETAELRRALEEGEIDIVAHMPISDALEARFSLTLPHWFTEDAVFVSKKSDAPGCPLANDARFAGERVIVLAEDPSWEWAEARGYETLARPSVMEALLALAAGEAGCAVLPDASASILIDRLGYDEEKIQKMPSGVKDDYDRALAFAVRQGDEELVAVLEKGLDIVTTSSDRYLAIFSRWDGWRGDRKWPRWLLWSLAPIALLLVWTWSLRRTVARRTAELEAEMLERQRLEQRVQQSRKMESLGVLAGGIAHDFNNLLMGVLGNASLAMHQVSEDSPVRPRLEEIRKAGRRAADLCGQMLAYSGKGRFVLEPVDLGEFLHDKEAELSATLESDVELRLEVDEELPQIRGDRAQLMQMLSQLVTNAAEALASGQGSAADTASSRDRVEITVSRRKIEKAFENPHAGELCPPGLYVALAVEDDGAGMDRATLGRIFEPFFSTKFTGRGLGLAAVLGIVRAHRGAIDVRSEPGRGTRVEVLLPAIAASADAAGAAPTPLGRADTMAVHAQDI